MGTPAQNFVQTLVAAIQGGCGYPCETGDLAGLIWTTAAQNLWYTASTQGMVGQAQFEDGLNSIRIAGSRHLTTLANGGDTTAAPALVTFLQTIADLEGQAATLPATAPNALDLVAAQQAWPGKNTPALNQLALRTARVIAGRFLQIPQGQLQSTIANWRSMISSTPPASPPAS
jgi:hypothetical protein